MKKIAIKLYNFLLFWGFDARIFLRALKPKKVEWFYRDLETLKKQKGGDQSFEFGDMRPIEKMRVAL